MPAQQKFHESDKKYHGYIGGIGAGKSDIQALGDEYGFGVLDMDNFDNVRDGQGIPFAVEIRGPCVLLTRKISNPLILKKKNLQQLS